MILIPSAYFPPVHYMAFFLCEEEILIEKEETYPKQTYRNRCYIYSPNGKLPLIVPVVKPHGNQTKTKEISIAYFEKWQLNHWRAIQTAYNSSPFFIYYRDELLPHFENRETTLLEHNDKILRTILELVGIDNRYTFTTSFEKDPDNITDLRNHINPKKDVIPVEHPPYSQVFSDKSGFMPNLSILDVLFNLGPDSMAYLRKVAELLNY